jgi:hypothetical protein
MTLSRNPRAKHILKMSAGIQGVGILEDQTFELLRQAFQKLDRMSSGTLTRDDFDFATPGIKLLWGQLLAACDIEGNSVIAPHEFVEGFINLAINQTMSGEVQMGSGWEILTQMQIVVNQHVLDQIALLRNEMNWW